MGPSVPYQWKGIFKPSEQASGSTCGALTSLGLNSKIAHLYKQQQTHLYEQLAERSAPLPRFESKLMYDT